MHWKVTNDFVWFSLWCVCEWSAYCFQCAFDVISLHLWLFGSCFSHTVSISLLCPLFILHLCTVTGSLIPPPFTTFRLWRPRNASVYRLVFLTFSVYHLCASRPSFIVCFVVVVCFGLVWSFSFRFAPVQSIHSSFFKWFFHVEALPFWLSLCVFVLVSCNNRLATFLSILLLLSLTLVSHCHYSRFVDFLRYFRFYCFGPSSLAIPDSVSPVVMPWGYCCCSHYYCCFCYFSLFYYVLWAHFGCFIVDHMKFK